MAFLDFIDTSATVIGIVLDVLIVIITGYSMFQQGKNIQKTKFNPGTLLVICIGLIFTVVGVFGITQPLRDPTIVMHTGRWMLAGLFLFFFVMGQSSIFSAVFSTFDRPIAKPIFIIELAAVIVSILFFGFQGRANFGVDIAANKICNGSFNSETSLYANGTTPHPIVLLYTQTGRGWQSAEYPPNWLPKSVKEIQLVACINDNWRTIETCDYGFNKENSIIRKQVFRTVTVIEATTGKTLDTFSQTGATPPECPTSAMFSSNQSTKVDSGNPIPQKTLLDLLESFVNQ